MISRVKYYRRRKAEHLRLRRKIKNFNYFLYTYRYLLRKLYCRIFKFHKNLKISLNFFKKSTLNLENNLVFTSKKRRHELDDYEDDEVPKKYHPEGLYYTYSKMTKIQRNFMTTQALGDGLLWGYNRNFLNSISKVTPQQGLSKSLPQKITNVTRIISTNFIRDNYDKIYRMDRIKFPLVKYTLTTKTLKLYLRTQYFFRKLSDIISKKILWKKIFLKNTLWKYNRMLKIKLVNKMKILIHKTYNNFYITAMQKNKDVILGYSAGCSGLTGSKRLSPVSAERVAKKFINKFFDKLALFANVDIYIKCKRVDAVMRNILNILLKTKKIQYSRIFKRRILIRLIVHKLLIIKTVSHNGVRKRHQRRV